MEPKYQCEKCGNFFTLEELSSDEEHNVCHQCYEGWEEFMDSYYQDINVDRERNEC